MPMNVTINSTFKIPVQMCSAMKCCLNKDIWVLPRWIIKLLLEAFLRLISLLVKWEDGLEKHVGLSNIWNITLDK